MKNQNVGSVDAALRAVLGVVMVGVFVWLVGSRPFLGISAALIAILLFGTALSGICPLYLVLRINTTHGDATPHGV